MTLQQHYKDQLVFHNLSENSILLTIKSADLMDIHCIYQLMQAHPLLAVSDIVPAYDSICILFDRARLDHQTLISILQNMEWSTQDLQTNQQVHEIPVCYELGLDTDKAILQLGLTKNEFIKLHTDADYTVAMIGFLPGFLYLSGMNEKLVLPRLSNPRTKVPAGAVGIGGTQSGIYGLESPGGWQIIGLTPLPIYNSESMPPIQFKAGDRLKFKAISEAEYNQLINQQSHVNR